ncbi:hypothetical protein, partial [Burkholderia multivorans]|uniref:hypothetical protein n=1 Tax=Burkholderia multivorans TaxID=87883 RepID=UPI001C65F8A5
ITAYLDRYARSLSDFDAEAAAGLWSIPGMIVDETFAGVLDSREAMAQGLEQSYPVYRKLGLASRESRTPANVSSTIMPGIDHSPAAASASKSLNDRA